MIIQKLFIFIVLCSTTVCSAQTKIIAHKSHSGSSKHFSKLYKKKGVNAINGNFGEVGSRNIILLDTVVAVNDSITVLKLRKSNVCYPIPGIPDYKELDDSDFESKTDTLVNNPIWNKSNTETFIRNSKRSQSELRIWFYNPFSEVVMVGFKKD